MSGSVHTNTRVWDRLRRKLRKSDPHVRVGIFGQERHEGSDFTIVEIATVHEFGAGPVPERSFIRRTFRVEQKKVAAFTAKLAKKVFTGGMSVEQALGLLGEFAAVEVKNTIAKGEHIPPPLAPETVARKGSDRPLVDTGQLINAITYEVRAK